MKHNIRFILMLIKLKLSHLMVFRLSFFGGFLADAMLFVIQLLTFELIYGQIDSIGGWSRGQMIIFIGTFSFINAIAMVFFFFGLNDIPSKIRDGELDLYMTKPANVLLRLTFENVNLGSVFLLIVSGLIVAHGISVVNAERMSMALGSAELISISFPLILMYGALVLLMTLLYYDLSLIIRTLPFFFITADTVQRLEGNMLDLNFKVPGVLYKGVLKVVFYFACPYGIMATIPTEALTQTMSTLGLIYAVSVTAIFTVFALWLWRFGMRRYKSASS